MKSWQSFVCIAGFTVVLTGCPNADYPTCSSPPVSHPGGKCTAYYYQTDYGSGGQTTQASVDCAIGADRIGGNVVAFHALDHGIGLKWLDANTLEVAVPEGVKLEQQRSGDVYSGYALRYNYRKLLPNDAAFSGCGLPRPGDGT